MKQFVDVKEVQETLGISEGKAYKVIRELNNQLKAAGYITIAGKVNRAFFIEKCCYGGKTA
jgi:predicted transcriptional regulator